MKVTNEQDVSSSSIDVTSNGWQSYTRLNLQDIYTKLYSGEWLTLSLGRASSGSQLFASWQAHGAYVDWAHINGIRITLSKKSYLPGPAPVLMLHWLRSAPTTHGGVVLFVFDDGYSSILPAAAYMRKFNMPGNVAVIGKATELPMRGYLDVYDLHMLQDQWGWAMVNHTQNHVDAMTAYWPQRKFGAYEQDILNGALWLQRAGLNSAPNWFIYPHGTTNQTLDDIVGRFYSFARTTGSGAETLPFGSPLLVKTLEVHSPHDVLEGAQTVGSTLTPVSAIVPAIRDAKTYGNTLIITFHRIHTTASDRPGYPLPLFKQIVDAVHAEGLPVVNFAQLDKMNGIAGVDKVTAIPPVPSLVTLHITQTSNSHSSGFVGWLRHLFS